MRNRGDGGTEPASAYHFTHPLYHIVKFVHQTVVTEHLGVGGQCATRHRTPWNKWLDGGRFRRQEILFHAILEDFLGNQYLVDVNVEFEIGTAQRVPHGKHVGLAGTAGTGGERKIDHIRTGIECRLIGHNTGTGRFVRMKMNDCTFGEQFPGKLHGFVYFCRSCGSRSVFETNGIERDPGIKNVLEGLRIKFRIMSTTAPRRKLHQRNADFVLQTRFLD